MAWPGLLPASGDTRCPNYVNGTLNYVNGTLNYVNGTLNYVNGTLNYVNGNSAVTPGDPREGQPGRGRNVNTP